MNPYVVVVDENDNFIRLEEKMKAHKNADLHRAFSLLIFNKKGEMLLQKRAKTKYHCPGEWTNACCSHPSLDGDLILEVKERLYEEMGMFAFHIKPIFKFKYKKEFDNGLTEHEIDTVLIGFAENNPNPNPKEVDDFKWISLENLYEDIQNNPQNYTFWFKEILNHPKFMALLGKSL